LRPSSRNELLKQATHSLEIPEAILLKALELELAEGALVADRLADRSCVFLAGLYQAEWAIAERLKAIQATPLPWAAIDPEKALPWIEAKTGLTLAASQKQAIAAALASPC
jgi:exodeoxyribonuclease V alpha subunit